MSRKSTRINFSIHPDSKEDMDGIFAELKKRLLPVSGTICKLLKQFKADGYRFNNYSLDVEIIVDNPEESGLKKGQICKAMIDPDDEGGFCVFNVNNHRRPWLIENYQAKVVKNG